MKPDVLAERNGKVYIKTTDAMDTEPQVRWRCGVWEKLYKSGWRRA